MGKRSDETVERPGGQRAIDPTVAFGQLRVVVVRAQQNFERPRAAHEARKVLDGARAGYRTEPGLRLTENRRLPRGIAHVAREHELAAGAAHASFDLRDRDEPACAQMAKQKTDRRFADKLRRLLPVSLILVTSTWEMK